ncbi:hypothetical protein I4641_21640 [Waterburya agarophytonicola K14]|uniref:DUF5648 domain-containing protein n=1 Tax=Waterburya agarophytonicola KI4 TaxID=2874699 RepID=A0A964BU75_9CYAN|nr:choice-of-anchor Q domain-containing protein [Waterburya agarophytonicola]MCC0179565.1 hypothetical protein [Waterburya agarophytonicola KI4]
MNEETAFIQENGINIDNPGSVIYVNQNATGDNSGASWENAYTDLQSALNSANELQEIWVAAGTYLPTTDGDREISFVIPDRVEVYGGFVGGETERGERDWQANSTVLSGNIGNPNDIADNSVHVVDISDTSSFFTVLDGFFVVEGYASRFERDDGSSAGDISGGGIYSFDDGEANLNNLIIANNFSENSGGGIAVFNDSELNINNVAFINNNADRGGAIYTSGTLGNITNSLFTGNRSESGGAIFILGGLRSVDYNLVNNTFYNNQADSGGVLYQDDFGSSGFPIDISNSIVYQNPTADGNVFFFEEEGNLTINNSIIQGGFDGSGENIIDTDPLFIDPSNLNFGLQSDSPGIDVGNNSAIQNIPNLDNTDFGGNTRIFNDTVDLGAYEFVLTQEDINNNPDTPPENDGDTLEGEPVYRFFIPNTGVHFYTANEVEKDNILATQPDYVLEGTPYNSAPADDSLTGVAPIYRFLNTNTGVHLYTISEAERESIETNLPNYQLEGIAYYGYTEQIENTTPVFRFYNPVIDAHFYTSSTVERDSVIANLPDYQLESNGGVAFYVEPIFNSATPISPPSNPETPVESEPAFNLGDILRELSF